MALVVKNPPANAGDMRYSGLIPGLGGSPGESHGNPLQYSCLENPIERGAWWAMVHRFAKSQTRVKQLSMQKEINSDYSLGELMLKLKLQCFGHLMQRADSLEKTLMLGKIEGRRRRGQQRMRWLDGITGSTDMSLGKL